MSFLTGKATQPIITPERIDKNRYRAPLFFGAIAVAAAMFSIPMFLTGSTTTALPSSTSLSSSSATQFHPGVSSTSFQPAEHTGVTTAIKSS